MESIFENKEKTKFTVIRIEIEILEKLKKMNKGSPNKAIKHLLNVNPESKLNNDLKELQNDVMALQDKFERLINLNKQLRF